MFLYTDEMSHGKSHYPLLIQCYVLSIHNDYSLRQSLCIIHSVVSIFCNVFIVLQYIKYLYSVHPIANHHRKSPYSQIHSAELKCSQSSD